jgi:hypothetical protein
VEVERMLKKTTTLLVACSEFHGEKKMYPEFYRPKHYKTEPTKYYFGADLHCTLPKQLYTPRWWLMPGWPGTQCLKK